MKVGDCIAAFANLGHKIAKMSEDEKDSLFQSVEAQNRWFTKDEILYSLAAWRDLLVGDKLSAWLLPYDLDVSRSPKSVGILMAGNIPAVGLHDLLAVLAVGHHACVKLSSSDAILMNWIISQLLEIEPRFSISVEEMLKSKDAYIATGSDNSARYFEYYFGKYPSLIRKNRTSVAILDGSESAADYRLLGEDVFRYFGLGCRNVSKLYAKDLDTIKRFLDALAPFAYIAENHKYFNNYEYNKSIYLVNRRDHLDNGFLLLTNDHEMVSPISVLYYELFENREMLESKLSAKAAKVQVVVSKQAWYPGSIAFGEAQRPSLDDYADGVDTIAFLKTLG